MCFHGSCHCTQTAIDGNGRTERLILSLDRSGYPTINVKFTDRKRYYDAFDVYYRDGRVEDMVRLIGEYVSEGLDRNLKLLEVYN